MHLQESQDGSENIRPVVSNLSTEHFHCCNLWFKHQENCLCQILKEESNQVCEKKFCPLQSRKCMEGKQGMQGKEQGKGHVKARSFGNPPPKEFLGKSKKFKE